MIAPDFLRMRAESHRLPIPDCAADVTADWLGMALRAGGLVDLPAIDELAVADIGAVTGLLAQCLRCRPRYRVPAADAPQTVIVKLRSAHPGSLRFSRKRSLYAREYRFYRYLARQAPVRSPKLLYGDYETGSQRFVLVMEDLSALQKADQLAGATAAQANAAIQALARLHGHYWNKTRQPPVRGLFDRGYLQHRRTAQLRYLRCLATTLRRFGHFFPAGTRRLVELYGYRIADHIRETTNWPQTFLHGDFRLDNLLFGTADGEECAVLDWQLSSVGNGLYDVAYFLGGSVTVDARRQMERAAVERYHETLCDNGVTNLVFADCWRMYRSNLLLRLLILMFACAELELDDEYSRRLVEITVERSLTAIEDLDAIELLPATGGGLSRSRVFSALCRAVYTFLRHVPGRSC